MPSPSKRPQRARRDHPVAEDESPSRPTKRRRKNDDAQTDGPDDENSSLVVDNAIPPEHGDTVVTRVAQHLAAPAQPPQASRDHANSIHEANKDGVKAFAKIAAQDWTFYITALVVNIGRTPEPAQQRTPEEIEEEKNDPKATHIDLGPSKLISRLHASIFFNAQNEEWVLSVKGRNALRVNGHLWKQGQEGPLSSGQVIEVAGVEMMFVIPVEVGPLTIDDQYLRRAGIVTEEEEEETEPSTSARPTRHPLPSGDGHHLDTGLHGKSAQKPLAPAPPDYKRPGTPPSVRARSMTVHKSPHLDNGPGGVLMGPSELDLSLDDNRHIKPQYSYAQMITQAIINTRDEKLNLNGIYTFIMDKYSYYRHQPASGWQNSIRHNLSLNKAFEKVARSTDEPGKGMKWQLVADVREDMIRTAYRGGRGGHRGSSNPSSPSQQLNYITQTSKDMAARDPLLSARKRKVSPSGSPQPKSSLRESHMTPVRREPRKPLPDEAGAGAEASPLPRVIKTSAPSSLSLSETAPALTESAPTPGSPTLTSSYMQEDGASFVTPAPHRVHPRLAPPSTAQRPSQHMPTSSPAPFWKYADIGSTPLKPAQDLSPSKALGLANLPQSSSPPPAPSKSPAASPTRPSRSSLPTAANTNPSSSSLHSEQRPSPVEPEEDVGFDLTKGFQSIGSYHAPVGHGKPVKTATNGQSSSANGGI